MTELETKLYWQIYDKLTTQCPMLDIEMNETQKQKLATDLAIMTARTVLNDRSTNYEGQQ